MKATRKCLFLFLAIGMGLFTAAPVQAQAQKWITGYYPYWWYDAVKPEQVDMNSITHLVLFNASPNPNTSPYLTGISAVEGGTNLSRILTLAHAKGVKVILSIGGIYGTEASNMRAIANDAAKSAVFAKYASDYALSKGIDGLEMDWEFPVAADRTGWNRLNRLIRAELDKWPTRGIYICAAYARVSGATDPYFAYVKDEMVFCFDQINAMTYTMWQGSDADYRSGFDTPVSAPTQFSGYNGYNLTNNGPMSFVNAGYPAALIGTSISFEGTKFSGVTTMGQKYSGWAFCSTVSQSAGGGYASIPTSGRQYDATAQAAYCISGGAVYSYQNEQSVTAIANWAKNNGLGGVMIYDFPAGYDLANSVPDILLKTVASTIRGGVTPPPPPPPVSLPATVQAENFTASLGVTVTTTTDVGGGSTVSSIQDNDWMEYAVNPPTSRTYAMDCRVANAGAAAAFQVKNSAGTVLGTINVPTTGGAQTFMEVVSNITLPAGVQTLRIEGTTAAFSLNWFKFSTVTTGVDDQPAGEMPVATRLNQNYPNPFNPSTSVSYQLSEAGNVKVQVFDLVGREVETLVDAVQAPGQYAITWNAVGRASGVYFVRLTAGTTHEMKRMVLLK